MKGLITLDIDGTTAVYGHPIAIEVVNFLKKLTDDNWVIMFITGRTVKAADIILKDLPFPFYVAVQNGALILEMPSKTIVNRKYLSLDILPIMQEICDKANTGFIIYSGFENHDICYNLHGSFSVDMQDYLKLRAVSFNETWEAIHSFDKLNIDHLSSVKCIGKPDDITILAAEIENRLGLHVPLIRDPFNEEYWVAQATHPQVNKGEAVSSLTEILGHSGVIIAAGDDNNDLTMLQKAHYKIVMASAPAELIALADVIAPPACQNGLIAGLATAINMHRIR